MYSTVIAKDGLFAVSWNRNAQQYERETMGTPLNFLRFPCTIDEGVTLGDILNAVEQYPELKGFMSLYSGCDVDAFHIEATLPSEPSEEIASLEVYRYPVIEFDGTFSNWVAFHGLPNNKDDMCYSVSMMPMNCIVHLPVRLMTKTRVTKETVEPLDIQNVADVEVEYSLLEVLDAIYWDISFYGSPDRRDTKVDELDKIGKKIKSGDAKTVPFNVEEFLESDN